MVRNRFSLVPRSKCAVSIVASLVRNRHLRFDSYREDKSPFRGFLLVHFSNFETNTSKKRIYPPPIAPDTVVKELIELKTILVG